MPQLLTATCPSPDCKAQFKIEIGDAIIFNHPSVSILAITHEHLITCAVCLKPAALVVANVGAFDLRLVPAPEPQRIINPNGLKL
jgi:hypothetical protein